ncbi:MAG: DUF502 domain-containing protein [Saprospiraceae bacterium]|nr:DUF502 domain-containing protein [Saprospiraceae bacterium]
MTFLKRNKILARRLQRFTINTLLGGLVVALPIALFISIIRLLFNLVIGIISPLKNLLGFSDDVNQWLINLLVVAAILTLFFLIGLAVRTEMGKRFFLRVEEQWLSPLPFYSIIRETVQQLFSRDKMPFSKVVLADVFGNGTLMTGFVTDEWPNGYLSLFVPTGPNPTNGFIFHVKKEQVIYSEVRTEEAMRSVISLGIGSGSLFAATMSRMPPPVQEPAA